MSIDLAAVRRFMAAHARLLDRRRLGLLLGEDEPAAVLGALAGYRNPDGGYGWGLEPDLRSTESQPAGALHAFEALAETGPAGADAALELCDWLAANSLPGGGLPFALPLREPAGSARWWAQADPAKPSVQITAVVAEAAHRVARHVPAVAAHPWLRGATAWCLEAIDARRDGWFAIELAFAMRFLDEVHDREPAAGPLLRRLRAEVPEDGVLPVAGGAEGEAMRPLDFAPLPGRAARALFDPALVEAELDRLAAAQQPDGGWPVEWATASPASTLEWRGYLTVHALRLLAANGRLDAVARRGT